jgi:hypothetical protein
MIYEVLQTAEGAWLVEGIDTEREGELYPSLFYGLHAERRAKDYAAWLNDELEASERIVDAS